MESKKAALATALTALGISFVTGALAAPETRVSPFFFCLLIAIGIAMIGVAALVTISHDVPLWLRSNRWISRELKDLLLEQHPLHSRLFLDADGTPRQIRQAHSYRQTPEKIQKRKPWHRLWFYLCCAPFVVAGILIAIKL